MEVPGLVGQTCRTRSRRGWGRPLTAESRGTRDGGPGSGPGNGSSLQRAKGSPGSEGPFRGPRSSWSPEEAPGDGVPSGPEAPSPRPAWEISGCAPPPQMSHPLGSVATLGPRTELGGQGLRGRESVPLHTSGVGGRGRRARAGAPAATFPRSRRCRTHRVLPARWGELGSGHAPAGVLTLRALTAASRSAPGPPPGSPAPGPALSSLPRPLPHRPSAGAGPLASRPPAAPGTRAVSRGSRVRSARADSPGWRRAAAGRPISALPLPGFCRAWETCGSGKGPAHGHPSEGGLGVHRLTFFADHRLLRS